MTNNHIHLNNQFFQPNHHPELPFITIHQHSQPHQHKQSHEEHSSHHQLQRTGEQNKFYQEFRRIYSVSHHLQTQKQRLLNVVGDLVERIRTIETKLNSGDQKCKQQKQSQKNQENISEQNRSKRARRTAQQIQKKYKCQVAFCQRYYGSQGSLQQHVKLKHPQLLQRQSSDEYRPVAGRYQGDEE